MVPQQAHIQAHHQINALARIGTITHDVSQAKDLIDILRLNVGEHGRECFEVSVNVANDRSQAIRPSSTR